MDVASVWEELEDHLVPMLASFRSAESLQVTRKADSTLLSEADEAVQAEIIRILRAADPQATILGEEGAFGPDLLRGQGAGGRTWIIDPIDGTAQFVANEGREFCSVVCLVEGRSPVAEWVLAPEIGLDRSGVRAAGWAGGADRDQRLPDPRIAHGCKAAVAVGDSQCRDG